MPTLKRTTKISVVTGGFLLGIGVGYWLPVLSTSVLAILGAIIAVLLIRRQWFLAFVLVFTLLGFWRGHADWARRQSILSLVGERVVVTGTIQDDPATDAKSFVDFHLTDATINGHIHANRLLIKSYYISVQHGNELQFEGKLGDAYGSNEASLGFAKITILSRELPLLDKVRARLATGMYNALPEPLAPFGLGLLIGTRSLLPDWLNTQLQTAGLSHLVAVSGYNLTILTSAVYRLLRKRSRFVALAASLWLMFGFVVITGASASVVRAAVVSVLSLLAAHYGRAFKAHTLVLLAAAITLVWRPDYLIYDLGWQLSFAAFAGIIILAPILEARFRRGKANMIKSLWFESLAAWLATAPLIAAVFSQFSFAGLIANLVILPLVPFAMLAGFIAGLAGIVTPTFAGFVAWPGAKLLGLIVYLVGWFASLPGAAVHYELPAWVAILLYVCLIVVSIFMKLHPRAQSDDIMSGGESTDVRTLKMGQYQTPESGR